MPDRSPHVQDDMPDATTRQPPTDPPAPSARERAALQSVLAPIAGAMEGVQAALDDITRTHAPYVQRLVEHVRGFGGKRLRPALVILAGRAVDPGAVGEVHARVGAVVELIHTATLVHDDILDGALVRRGRSRSRTGGER